MSITALYIFTPTEFTTPRFNVIEYLSEDGSSPPGYSVMPKPVSGEFTLDPGVYRLQPGVTITPAPTAVEAAIPPTGTIANPTGFTLSPIASTKTGWPDPPATAASSALGIPMDALAPFLADAGEQSVLAPASGAPTHSPAAPR